MASRRPLDLSHDGASYFDGCEVKAIKDGAIQPTGITGIRAALRLSGDRLLLLRAKLDLVVRLPSGEELTIAAAAYAPTASADGEQAAFTQFPDGTTAPALEGPAKLVLYDVATGERRDITDDPGAYAPHVIPGTSDVLFVTGRTSVASLWIAPKGKAEYQLTNQGLTRAGKGFVPVPSHQLVWLPGTRKAVYTARYGDDKLWMIDVDTGITEVMGPGRFPNLTKGDKVLGFYPGPTGDVERIPVVFRYLEQP